MKHARLFSLLALFLTALLLFTACSASTGGKNSVEQEIAPGSPDSYYSKDDAFPSGDIPYDGVDKVETESGSQLSDRKIIRNLSLTLQTLDFETGIAAIESQAIALGGYVENSSIYGNSLGRTGTTRSAEYVLRIPVSALDAYVGTLGDEFNVLRRTESSSDVSEHYYDMQARLNSLEVQEARLLEMLKTADQLEYLLQLEDKLSSVRYEIESYTASLKRYDNLVDYATVMISLQEVVDYSVVTETPTTFGERIANAFVSSWEGFAQGVQSTAVAAVYALPLILIAGIAVIVIVLICRSRKRKKAAKAVSPEKKD